MIYSVKPCALPPASDLRTTAAGTKPRKCREFEIIGMPAAVRLCTKPRNSWHLGAFDWMRWVVRNNKNPGDFGASYCTKPRIPQDFGGFVPRQIHGKFSVSYHDMFSSSRGKEAAAKLKQQQQQQKKNEAAAAAAEADEAAAEAAVAAVAAAVKQQQQQQR